MKRQLTAGLAVVVLIWPVSAIPQNTVARQSSIAQQRSIEVPGLQKPVTIRRDDRGIPYIEARNDHDLYLAQGYVTASDRLWQMDLLRRTARGELAEIFGNNALDEDKRHRTFGFSQIAEAEAAQASGRSRTVLDAYTQGVNAYIASLDAKSLPPEFRILQYQPRSWTVADSLILVKLFFESLSSSWPIDVMREAFANLSAEKRAALLPETSPLDVILVGSDTRKASAFSSAATDSSEPFPGGVEALAKDYEIASRSLGRIGLYAESLAASNNWVVSGKHTASGKPLLANDPHLAPSAPPIWYLVHLSAPGVRVAGVTSPGLPGVVIGHNDHIAWGYTNVGADVQDLYLEKFDPDNSRRYLTPAGWRDADVRHEEIKVRKSFTDSATNVTSLDVTVTRHGPIVFEKGGKRYALRWTALDPTLNNPDVTYSLNRARDWKEFNAALSNFTAPTQNVIYADTNGHIGYHAAGVVPIRKSGDGSVPYDGSIDAGEWVRYIPFDKLPQLFNPPSGIIVTANQRIVGSDYPYFLSHVWAQPYRARRIFDLLHQKEKLTADQFRAIQKDVYSIGATLFARQTAKILRSQLTPADERLRETIAAFEAWDGQINADSRVAPVLAQMRIAFRSRILTAALGEQLVKLYVWTSFDTSLDRIITEQPNDWLPKEFKDYADLLRACYQDAHQVLTKNLGTDESKWTWGEMVMARFPHPLAGVPLVGLQFTIAPFPQNGTGGLAGASVNVGSAVSMRLVADPGDWDKSQQGITLGESGIPSSPHWSDQLEDWRAVTPREFPYTDAAINRATREKLELEPAKQQGRASPRAQTVCLQ